MDPRERLNEREDAQRAALYGRQATIWTSMPGIIESFDAGSITATVQISISGVRTNTDGSTTAIELPLLVDVPVFFPAGGGYTLTFPVEKGDECLVSFAARAIDAWWQSGGIQPPVSARMHDLSDGFAFVGFRSQRRILSDISGSATQLRSDDGTTFVEVTSGTVRLKAPAKIVLDAPVVEFTGTAAVLNEATAGTPFTVAGSLSATDDVLASGKSLRSHVHSGVQPGSGTTGGPV